MKEICLIVWMLISLIFVCSIIGLVMFVPKNAYMYEEDTVSTWYSIGIKLLNSVIKNK